MIRPTTVLLLSLCSVVSLFAEENDSKWYQRKAKWKGYDQFHFKVKGQAAYLVVPTTPVKGNPWIWRARFPGYHAEMDVKLLGKGLHVAYVDVAGKFGSPEAVAIGDAFYDYMTKKRGLAKRPAMEGVSRGGLFVYNWAGKNSRKVSCIYCDTPVLDFKSWPGGKGTGLGAAGTWKKCLQAYKLQEQEAIAYKLNPVDDFEAVATAKIPILHIVSENDRVVPPKENTYLLKKRLEKNGHGMEIISVLEGTKKSNGHHFTHPEPERVVDFIWKHTTTK